MDIEKKWNILLSVKDIEKGFGHLELWDKKQLIEYFEIAENKFNNKFANYRDYFEEAAVTRYWHQDQIKILNESNDIRFKACSHCRLLFNKEHILALVEILKDKCQVANDIYNQFKIGIELENPIYKSKEDIEKEKELESILNNKMQFIFEENQVEVIRLENKIMFELYSTGMALGYENKRKNATGKEYISPYKSRIDKIVENAEITCVCHLDTQYLTEEQLYDFMLESRTDKCKVFRKSTFEEYFEGKEFRIK